VSPGTVEGIYVGAVSEGPLEPADEVVVVAGRGIEGDRYFAETGTFSDRGRGGRDLTLFEAEALEGLLAEHGIELAPHEIRRNVMTGGIGLNDLVGRHFRVGEVECVGDRLCDPCTHLEGLTQPGVLRGLVNRGGLRADVVKGGVMRVGDPVVDLGPAVHASSETRFPTGRGDPGRSE
jgi:MOSC domain-containing protein YiiM